MQLFQERGAQSPPWLHCWALSGLDDEGIPCSFNPGLACDSGRLFILLPQIMNWRCPIARCHGFVNVNTTRSSEPPVSTRLVFTGQDSVVIYGDAAVLDGPFPDTLKIEIAVLFHLLGVTPRKALAIYPWLVGEEAWVHGRELKREHFCPAKVDDTATGVY